jgi:hypothetical protein
MMKISDERPAGVVIETLDGRAYVGVTLYGAIDSMRRDAWGCHSQTMRSYQRAVARRVLQWNKYLIRTEQGIKVFAEDLQASGIITIRNVQ